MSEDTNEEQADVEGHFPDEQPTTPIPIPLATVKIAGIHYCIPSSTIGNFRRGDPIALRREPTNTYDDKAVEVLWRGHGTDSTFLKVGYVPKPLAQAIFALIQAGYDLHAEVTEDCKSLITISMRH